MNKDNPIVKALNVPSDWLVTDITLRNDPKGIFVCVYFVLNDEQLQKLDDLGVQD